MIHGYWLPTKDGTLKLYIVQNVTEYVMYCIYNTYIYDTWLLVTHKGWDFRIVHCYYETSKLI